MSLTALLKKDFKLPPFRTRALLYACLLLLLPNAVFLLAAWFTSTARPLLNLDYLWVGLLFVLPFRLCRWLAVAVFWFFLLFDVLMLVMQLFPFMDLAGALYLLPFITKAPLMYQAMSLFLLAYLLLFPVLLHHVAKRTNLWHTVCTAVLLFIVSYFTGHLVYYKNPEWLIFGGNNHYYGKSQFELYREVQGHIFLEAARTEPVFTSLKYQRAANRLDKPFSDKILLIVNESWGTAKNLRLQEAILAKITEQKHNFSLLETGHFRFVGATVEGEMRELCGTGIKGFGLKHTPSEKFATCLPQKLKQSGYATYALHGASSLLYDRFSWYPKAGFAHTNTAETLPNKPRCHAFNGACDHALFSDVKAVFAQHSKVFYYWLTLTTHANYSANDLFNHRLSCTPYGMDEDAELCRNFKLQAQFFDDLALLLQQPEMKGVEVLVVGDHPPPTANLREVYRYTAEGNVSWLHLKVKP